MRFSSARNMSKDVPVHQLNQLKKRMENGDGKTHANKRKKHG